ncbi:MAG: dTDP-4-dehydrorhamnose reductase [Ignavibacteria bacterium]|nr:dTDP-4-dehydrorhamnose reductase [Ignavibacteria bacterium]
MKYLLIGSLGQLGTEFKNYFQKNNIDFIETDLPTLDVGNFDDVDTMIGTFKPDVVINCSAYNYVDQAENDRWTPIRVNTIGVRNIAYLCRKYNSFLVHFSTDYVFDGEKPSLYFEEDKPNPINFYGLSKFLGELSILEELEEYLILRVSWLYGFGTQNFIVKFLNWSEETDTVRVSIDEISVPTSTRTVVAVTMKSINEGLVGLFHLTNSGYASRFEWALELKKQLGLRVNVIPAKVDEFQLPAKRPKFSAMSNQKISDLLGISIPPWREELENFLNIFASKN